MQKLKKILIAFVFFVTTACLSNVVSAEGGDIVFRKIEGRALESNVTVKRFECDDCFMGKGALSIDLGEAPLLIIPNNQINNIKLFSLQCIDFPYSTLLIEIKRDYSGKLKQFSEEHVKKNVALFFDGEYIYSTQIYEPIENTIQISTCLSYERAVVIAINNHFKPNYEETCIGGKRKIEDLSRKYRFNKTYVGAKKYYEPVLRNSEFWYIQVKTPMYDKPNGKKIKTIFSEKIVEQSYNSRIRSFERVPGWIKILYEGQEGWIREKYGLPLFSILDSNLFLEKFFIFNEHRYKNIQEHSKGYSDYMIGRVNNIRKFYIEEALARFENKDEFRRWYFDTFKHFFEE